MADTLQKHFKKVASMADGLQSMLATFDKQAKDREQEIAWRIVQIDEAWLEIHTALTERVKEVDDRVRAFSKLDARFSKMDARFKALDSLVERVAQYIPLHKISARIQS